MSKAFFKTKAGTYQHVDLDEGIYPEANQKQLTVKEMLNAKFHKDCDQTSGTPFQQLSASCGIFLPGQNSFGLRAGTFEDVVEGRMMAAGPSNEGQRGAPFGQAARVLFPVAMLELIENQLVRDYGADSPMFDQMIANEVSINTDNFIQPVINYQGEGGPHKAKAQRVSEFAEPGNMLQISTSENPRSLPAFTIGVEYSSKAQKALTIDVLALTIARYTQIERDERVYGYMSTLFMGDNDLVSGTVPSVTSTSLDAAATGGVLTHRAWLKFLARNRRFRRITHVMGDIDAYLKVESRTGRPGSNNYDPTLARIDPQARVMNVSFGNDVKWFLTDAAVDGGPVPAGEVWAIDATQAITRIKNASADYKASQEFALRRSTAMRWDWGEAVLRAVGDTDLRPFDRLVIS